MFHSCISVVLSGVMKVHYYKVVRFPVFMGLRSSERHCLQMVLSDNSSTNQEQHSPQALTILVPSAGPCFCCQCMKYINCS